MTRVLLVALLVVAAALAQQTAKPAAAAAKPAAPAAPKPAAAAAAGISCVQCATTRKGEEQCADEEQLAKFTKKCNPLKEGAFKDKPAVGCRKILQNIGDEKAIFRECAYSGEDVHAQRKTGNMGILLFYYQCSDNVDGKPCNSVSSASIFGSLLVALGARFLQ